MTSFYVLLFCLRILITINKQGIKPTFEPVDAGVVDDYIDLKFGIS
jgi:hypothetical protein